MRVFLSWSGNRSRQVAELLVDWIGVVIQAAKPWISTDIERGASWAAEISASLGETNVGVLCITAENKNAPWILFEAGALAKGLTKSRVIPLLIDLPIGDLGLPLSQFNASTCDRAGMEQLIYTVNKAMVDQLPQQIVSASINAHWAAFEAALALILEGTKPANPPRRRSEGDKLDDLLALVHSLGNRIESMERRERPSPRRESLLAWAAKQGIDTKFLSEKQLEDLVESATADNRAENLNRYERERTLMIRRKSKPIVE